MEDGVSDLRSIYFGRLFGEPDEFELPKPHYSLQILHMFSLGPR
jgi:hypothetical protein